MGRWTLPLSRSKTSGNYAVTQPMPLTLGETFLDFLVAPTELQKALLTPVPKLELVLYLTGGEAFVGLGLRSILMLGSDALLWADFQALFDGSEHDESLQLYSLVYFVTEYGSEGLVGRIEAGLCEHIDNPAADGTAEAGLWRLLRHTAWRVLHRLNREPQAPSLSSFLRSDRIARVVDAESQPSDSGVVGLKTVFARPYPKNRRL